MEPDLLTMDKRTIYFYCVAFILLSYTKEVLPSNLYSLNLMTTWDGRTLTLPEVNPVTFSLGDIDGKHIVVTFNSTVFMDLKSNTIHQPEVFGIMFKGEENRYVHIQVDATNNYFIKLFNGFDNELHPEESLVVDFKSIPDNNTWNGTITVPVEYLPRATNEIAAYANFTVPSNHKTEVFTLRSINSTSKVVLPNMHKNAFFQEINFQQYLPIANQNLIHWSSLWRELLHISPGGSVIHPNTTEEVIYQDNHHDNHNNKPNAASHLQTLSFAAIMFCLIVYMFNL